MVKSNLQKETEYQKKLVETISHDITTPIRFIAMLSQKLHESDDVELQKKYFDSIYKSSEQLYQFTLNLKEYTELYKAENIFEEKEYPINRILEIKNRLFCEIAKEKGIDLKYVQGTGEHGRITRTDLDNYTPGNTSSVAKASAPRNANFVGQVSFVDTPVSQMRKTIARRLSESLFTAPHFYITMSIDMDAAVAARAKINEVAPVKISFNDMVVKATALSLKQHPKINSSWLGDTIRTNHHVNIGIAVAVDEGLLVPVVRFADTKSLSEIGVTVKGFAQKAKDKKLQPADWEGSTFTISNLGMFGVDEFTAIINPPDACILAVGTVKDTVGVVNGEIKPVKTMKVTLSCDHRVVDGAMGAQFLKTLKEFLEEPYRLLV